MGATISQMSDAFFPTQAPVNEAPIVLLPPPAQAPIVMPPSVTMMPTTSVTQAPMIPTTSVTQAPQAEGFDYEYSYYSSKSRIITPNIGVL